MKYCTKCGNQLFDEAVACPKCGCATGKTLLKSNGGGELSLAAKIFMILGTILMGFWLFPLAWCIPMTITYCRKINNGEPISLDFKICCLLFVSLVGGILMLCDND